MAEECATLSEINRICDAIARSPRLWSSLDVKTDGELQAKLISQLKVFLLSDGRSIAQWTKSDILVALLDNESWHGILGHEFMLRLHERAEALGGEPEWDPSDTSVGVDTDVTSSLGAFLDEEREKQDQHDNGGDEFDHEKVARDIVGRQGRFEWGEHADAGEDDDVDADIPELCGEGAEISGHVAIGERNEIVKYASAEACDGGAMAQRRTLIGSLRHGECRELLKVIDCSDSKHVDALVRLDKAFEKRRHESDSEPPYNVAAREMRAILQVVRKQASESLSRHRLVIDKSYSCILIACVSMRECTLQAPSSKRYRNSRSCLALTIRGFRSFR